MQNSIQQQSVESSLSQFEITKGIYTSGMLKTLKIAPCAKLILIAISTHYPNIFPSIKFLSESLGISQSSVKNAIKELRLAGLIIYTCSGSNHYKFTQKFFELVKITHKVGKNYPQGSQILSTNKQNNKKINKPDFKNFKKGQSTDHVNKRKYHSECHITGINYPKYTPPERIEATNPAMVKEWQALKDKLKKKPLA